MARYKAEKALFITDPGTKAGRLVKPGEAFASDDPPGKFWEPLDDAAKEAAASRRPAALGPREASIAREREAARERAAPEKRRPGRPPGLKGRDDGNRTPDASRAKDRPPTPGKSVTEQQTDGEEPTRD